MPDIDLLTATGDPQRTLTLPPQVRAAAANVAGFSRAEQAAQLERVVSMSRGPMLTHSAMTVCAGD